MFALRMRDRRRASRRLFLIFLLTVFADSAGAGMIPDPQPLAPLAGHPAGRQEYSAVAYAVVHRITGDTLAGGTLLAVALELTRGSIRWERDTLFIAPGTVGSFSLDQTSHRVDPAGFLWLEVKDGAVSQSVGGGVYAGRAPAIGDTLPLALPLTEGLALDFDLDGYHRRDIEIHVYAVGQPGEGLIIQPDPLGETIFVNWPRQPTASDSAKIEPTASRRH